MKKIKEQDLHCYNEAFLFLYLFIIEIIYFIISFNDIDLLTIISKTYTYEN